MIYYLKLSEYRDCKQGIVRKEIEVLKRVTYLPKCYIQGNEFLTRSSMIFIHLIPSFPGEDHFGHQQLGKEPLPDIRDLIYTWSAHINKLVSYQNAHLHCAITFDCRVTNSQRLLSLYLSLFLMGWGSKVNLSVLIRK